jgi:hypothetical protein
MGICAQNLGRGMREWKSALAALVALGIVFAFAAFAQDDEPGGQLSLDRLAYIQPGSYLAGDSTAFTLDSAGGNYLLRFGGASEVFVLYVDRGSLGGRVLKYDSGETALNVSGWGGMTLYPDSAPQGLPAVRTGDSQPPFPPSISLQDMQNAAGDEGERLGYVRRLNVQFTADWNALADNPNVRGFAFDAMENAARGIERFTSNGGAHDAFARRISAVMVSPGSKPTLGMNGRTLIVTFNPGWNFAGRASSRAIARALRNVLSH